uniref:C-type lectin domain-containing protein n=1 Tax=Saccoglossus kowalevskii TaxID=10224 RepID=A0ABM0MCX7_SACKO
MSGRDILILGILNYIVTVNTTPETSSSIPPYSSTVTMPTNESKSTTSKQPATKSPSSKEPATTKFMHEMTSEVSDSSTVTKLITESNTVSTAPETSSSIPPYSSTVTMPTNESKSTTSKQPASKSPSSKEPTTTKSKHEMTSEVSDSSTVTKLITESNTGSHLQCPTIMNDNNNAIETIGIGGRCYWFGKNKSTWNIASEWCEHETRGGHLVKFDNEDEEREIYEYINIKTLYWTSGICTPLNKTYYDCSKKENWVWYTGDSSSLMSYDNWSDEEPSSSNEKMCMVSTGGPHTTERKWCSEECSVALAFICEF